MGTLIPNLGRLVRYSRIPNFGTNVLCFSYLTKPLFCNVCATYLAILLYVLSINLSIACDPVGDLKSIGIRLKSLPQVIEEPNNKWPGDFTLGVIHVRSLTDCQVLLHEFAHHYQFERGGSAQSYNEWWERELEAEAIAKKASRHD